MRRRGKKPSNTNGFPAPFQGFEEPPTADYRGMPTMSCPCGSDWLTMVFQFDPDTRLPGFFLLDGLCASCGAILTLACPADMEMTRDGV